MNKRVLASLAGSAGAVLLIATASAAAVGTNVRVPFTGVVQNTCTGESMAADTVDHLVMSATTNDNHVSLSYHDNQDGSLVGLSSGIKYQISAVQESHLNFGAGATNSNTVLKLRINGHGSAPDLVETVNMHFTVDASGNISVWRDSGATISCG